MMTEGLVANGATVVIASRDGEKNAATAERLNADAAAHGGHVYALGADLASYQGCDTLVSEVAALVGGKLHGLINNSGRSWGAEIDEYSIERFDQTVQLNLNVPFYLTQQCLPMLEAAQTEGNPSSVINIGSIDGMRTPGTGSNTYAYSSSKMGLIALTRHLGKDLAPRNLTVNLIAPGPFYTKLLALNNPDAYKNFGTGHPAEAAFKRGVSASNPSGRLGEGYDAAGAAIFLLSKAGSYVNGATINLDGGSWLGSKL